MMENSLRNASTRPMIMRLARSLISIGLNSVSICQERLSCVCGHLAKNDATTANEGGLEIHDPQIHSHAFVIVSFQQKTRVLIALLLIGSVPVGSDRMF